MRQQQLRPSGAKSIPAAAQEGYTGGQVEGVALRRFVADPLLERNGFDPCANSLGNLHCGSG